jgi:hypothetical protein
MLRAKAAARTNVRGADADDAARRGSKAADRRILAHRTGHSIDAGDIRPGPNLDIRTAKSD